MQRATTYLLTPICIMSLMVGSVAASSNNGEQRPNTPIVLEHTPKISQVTENPSETYVQTAFTEAYRKADTPRIVILWNQIFSDRLREYEASELAVMKNQENITTTEKGEGVDAIVENMSANEWSLGIHRKDDSRISPLSEVDGFRFETGFSRPFLMTGANLINRASIMRITHAENLREASLSALDDKQLIETRALQGYADLMIEILASQSSKSVISFRVSVLDIKTGQIKADFVKNLNPERSNEKEKWAAVQGGYTRIKEYSPGINPEEMGRTLALQTMSELVRIWEKL